MLVIVIVIVHVDFQVKTLIPTSTFQIPSLMISLVLIPDDIQSVYICLRDVRVRDPENRVFV